MCMSSNPQQNSTRPLDRSYLAARSIRDRNKGTAPSGSTSDSSLGGSTTSATPLAPLAQQVLGGRVRQGRGIQANIKSR